MRDTLITCLRPAPGEGLALRPDPVGVYERAVSALTAAPVQPPPIPEGIRWTTLDYVLLGWIAAQGARTLPASRGELYEQVLEHEEGYWSTVYHDTVRERQPRRARLRKAAACLSLVAAPEPRPALSLIHI